jgi:AcrR family transcriptional regulator
MAQPPTKTDRRIARTEYSLHRALNTLVLEKGYSATTVHDIACRANVGRSTLYAHHGGKEGLLLHGLQHFHEALRAAPSTSSSTPPVLLGFSRTFFEHVHSYRDIFAALRSDECGTVVVQKMKRMLRDLIREELKSTGNERRRAPIPQGALVRFTVGSIFSVLMWWLDEASTLPPSEADRIFRQLVLPAWGGA